MKRSTSMPGQPSPSSEASAQPARLHQQDGVRSFFEPLAVLKSLLSPLLLVLLGIGLGAALMGSNGVSAQTTATPPQLNLNFIAEVAQKVGPAVVRIDSERTVRVPGAFPEEFFSDPFFRDFFGQAIPSIPANGGNRALAPALSSARTARSSPTPMWSRDPTR